MNLLVTGRVFSTGVKYGVAFFLKKEAKWAVLVSMSGWQCSVP